MFCPIDWDTIMPIWKRDDMWGPAVFSKTNPYLYDTTFIEKLKSVNPVYYAYMIDDNIAGVNSYYRCTDDEVRSRGLYVFPSYRGRGIGEDLLRHAIDINRNRGYKFMWSKPRTAAKSVYVAAGFSITSTVFYTNPDNTNTIHPNYMCKYEYHK